MSSVGEILRAEREKQGLSIKDIEKATSIRSTYISAIEEGNYRAIPGEVYLKGFIRNYSSFLGLNSKEMLELYRQSLNKESDKEQGIEKIEEKVVETPPARGDFRLKYILIGLVIACIVGVGVWLTVRSSNTPPSANQSKPIPSVPVQPDKTSDYAQPQVVEQAKSVTVTAKYADACWTMVIADGKNVYEGTAKAGESLTWEAKKDIVIKLGNAGAVEILKNGQPQGKLGSIGEVVERTYSVDKK